MSSSLRPHGLQHARPPCPPLSPRVCSNSCPLSQWCHPTVSSSVHLLLLPSIFLRVGVFSNQSGVCIRWSKYWSFSFSIIPANENSGLISFRMDWLNLLAVQGTLKSLLQHHSSKASILWWSTFLWSNSQIHTWLPEKPQLWLYGPLSAKWCLCFLTHCLGLLQFFFQGTSIMRHKETPVHTLTCLSTVCRCQATAFSPPSSVSRLVSYIRSMGFNCSQQEEEGKVHLLHLPRSRSLFLMSSQIMI